MEHIKINTKINFRGVENDFALSIRERSEPKKNLIIYKIINFNYFYSPYVTRQRCEEMSILFMTENCNSFICFALKLLNADETLSSCSPKHELVTPKLRLYDPDESVKHFSPIRPFPIE